MGIFILYSTTPYIKVRCFYSLWEYAILFPANLFVVILMQKLQQLIMIAVRCCRDRNYLFGCLDGFVEAIEQFEPCSNPTAAVG